MAKKKAKKKPAKKKATKKKAKKKATKKKATKKKATKKKATKKKATKKKATKKKATKKKAKKKKRKANPALMKPLNLSPELAAVCGTKKASRGQVMKKLWAYIKKKDCQDAVKRRYINPDATLAKVIGKKQIDMFKMTKQISKHLS